MNRLDEQVNRIAGGRLTLNPVWVPARITAQLEQLLPNKPVPTWVGLVRIAGHTVYPLILLYLFFEPFWDASRKWRAIGTDLHWRAAMGDVNGVISATLVNLLIVTPISIYAVRHLPKPGRYPGCHTCGRSNATREALAHRRRLCTCGRVLPMDRVVGPTRRAWTSL